MVVYVVMACHHGQFDKIVAYKDSDAAYQYFNARVNDQKATKEDVAIWDEIGGKAASCSASDVRLRICEFEIDDNLSKIWVYAMGEEDKYFQIGDCGVAKTKQGANNYFEEGMKSVKEWLSDTPDANTVPSADGLEDCFISTEFGGYGYAEWILTIQEVEIQ